MPALTTYTATEVQLIGVTDRSHLGKTNQYYALKDGVRVRISLKNYKEIKKTWKGATSIHGARLACPVEDRGYHAMRALQLGVSLEAYASWQEAACRSYQATGTDISYEKFKRAA
jgi:hypothetical protein